MDGIATKGFQSLGGRGDKLAQLGHVSLVDGKNNAAVGLQAGTSVKNGSNNVFFGSMSGASAMANGSTFLGAATGQFATRVKDSCFVGFRAGQYANRVDASVCIGPSAGRKMTRANCNTLVGFQAGAELTSGSRNTVVGSLAAFSQYNGSDNVCIGHRAGYQNRVGSNNCYIGSNSGFSAVNGLENVCVGVDSGQLLSRGTKNVLLGYAAGASISNASNCIAIGTRAMEFFFDGDTNTCLGTQTAQHFSGKDNTILGGYAAANASGNFNTIIGSRSMNRASKERVNLSNCVIVGENIQFDIPIRRVTANVSTMDLLPDAQGPGVDDNATLTLTETGDEDNARSYLEINVVPVGDPVLVRSRYIALGSTETPVRFDTSEPGTYTVRWGSAPSESLDLLDPIPVVLSIDVFDDSVRLELESYGDSLGTWTLAIGATGDLWVSLEQTFEDPPAIKLNARTASGSSWHIDEAFDDIGLPGTSIPVDPIPVIEGTNVTVFATESVSDLVPGMAIQILNASVGELNGVWRIRSIGATANGRTPLAFSVNAAPTLETTPNLGGADVLASRVVTVSDVAGTVVGANVRFELPQVAGMLFDPDATFAFVDGALKPVTVIDKYAGVFSVPGTGVAAVVGSLRIGSFEPLIVGFDIVATGPAKSVSDFSVIYAQRSDKGVQTSELTGPSASDGHSHRGAGSLAQMDARIANGELTFVDGTSYADYVIGSANSNVSARVTFEVANDADFGIEWLDAYALRCSLGSTLSTFGASLTYAGAATAPRVLTAVTSAEISASGSIAIRTAPGETPTLPVQLAAIRGGASSVFVTLDIRHRLRLREIDVTANVFSTTTGKFAELTFGVERALPVSSTSSAVSLFATKPARASGLTIQNTNYQLYPTFSDCIFLGSNFTVGSSQDARLDQKANVFVAAIGNVPMFKGSTDEFAFFSDAVTMNACTVANGATFEADVDVAGELRVKGPADVDDTMHVSGNVAFDADLTVSGTVSVAEDVDVTGNVSVEGDVAISGDLVVTSTTTLDGALTARDDAVFQGLMTVRDAATFADDVTVRGDTALQAATGTTLTLSDDLAVGGDATIAGALSMDSVILKSGSRAVTLDVNDAYFGNMKVTGSPLGGWDGIRFPESSMMMVFRETESGFYHEDRGWQLNLKDGSLYVQKNLVAYHSFSDARLKTNLRPFDSLDMLRRMPAHEFDWKATGAAEIGLIAQDVRRVMPWAVHSSERTDDKLVVDYAKVVPLLVDAVAKLEQRVAELESAAR